MPCKEAGCGNVAVTVTGTAVRSGSAARKGTDGLQSRPVKTDNPAPTNAGQQLLIGVAGLWHCIWALLTSNRFWTRGMRAACARLGAFSLVTGLVFMYR